MLVGYHRGHVRSTRNALRPAIRTALLATTALLSLPLLGGAASAQVTIDGGTTVDVPGTQASPWNVGASLFVGGVGSGTLNIGDGTNPGVVTSGPAAIGLNSTGTGTVNIVGAGSLWDLGGSGLAIGGSGTGHLTISGGGRLDSAVNAIGNNPGSVGTVVVSGAGSIWNASSDLRIGNLGTGSLAITNGGTVASGDSTIGGAPASGNVLVTGAGSTWTTGKLWLGVGGLNSSGTLTIGGDGVVNTIGDASIGRTGGSQGEVSVSGAGASWNIAGGFLVVGDAGSGTLNIGDGVNPGGVTTGPAGIGSAATATGTVNIAGVGSYLNVAGSLMIGGAGIGHLTISSGGQLDSTVNTIGNSPGATGTVAVSGVGSIWNASSDLLIGNLGMGSLTITNGGTVSNASPGQSTIGSFQDSTGAVVVDGANSLWANTGPIAVAFNGQGSLTIGNGGKVTASFVDIGASTNGTGGASVSGANSLLEISGDLRVGSLGFGALAISGGGKVTNVNGTIGNGPGYANTVSVDGANSSWVNSSQLYIGNGGSGTLSISNGGLVKAGSAALAMLANGEGVVTVDGANSRLEVGNFYVGYLGDGTVTVSNGGTVAAGGVIGIAEFAGATGRVNIGAAASDPAAAPGTLDVQTVLFDAGNARLVFNHTGSNYTFSPQLSGMGTVDVYAGTTILTADSGAFAGGTNIRGGSLIVNGKLGGLVTVAGGSTLGGSGTLTGNVDVGVMGAGTLAPGNSPGTLTIGGNLTLSSIANLNYELGSPGGTPGVASDLINVGGNLTLDGTLNVADAGGFGAGLYRLINYGGTLTDSGLDIGTRPAGYAAGDLTVQTGTAGQVNLLVGTASALAFWNGPNLTDNGLINGGTGTWTRTGTNWTNAASSASGPSDPAAMLVFAGAAGTVTVDNGAGQVTATGLQFATSGYLVQGGPLALAGAGTSIVRVGDGTPGGAGTVATIAAPLTGTSGLRLTDYGTLILTGENSYAGGTIIERGTLQLGNGGASGSILGDIVNDGALAFNRSDAVTFTGAISGNGTLRQVGSGTLTLTGANSYSGGTVISAGTLVGSATSFGSGTILNSAALVIDQPADANFANAIDGTGSFTKRGTGSLNLTGTGSLSGPTTVEAGRLAVNGSLANSAVTVVSGAMLGGNGAVGATTVQAGATIAPGNSIGTLNINGNLVLAPGATYAVEIAGNGASDRIAVSGHAAIGGSNVTVTALDPQASYSNGQRYTILTASGGIDGAFAAAASQSAFIDVALDYKTNAVELAIAVKGSDPGTNPVLQPTLFGRVAQTRNQLSTARALDTLPQVGGTLALYNSLLVLDASSARAAFDALSGDAHASAKTALVEESWLLRGAMNDRLRSAFGSVGATPMATMDYGFTADLAPSVKGSMPRLNSERFAVWGQGYGAWGRTDADRNASKLTRSTGGFLLGADVAAFDTMRFGLIAGYSRSQFDVKGRLSSGESDNYHLGLYGGGQWGAVSLRTGASYTWHEIETSRIVAFPGFGNSLRADYNAGTAQVFGELGYRIDLGRVALEPFAGLAYVNLHTDGFNEIGGAAALSGRSDNTSLGYSTLGLRASTSLDLQGMPLTLRGGLAWRHAFGDVDPTVTLAFAGSSAFTVAGLPIARDAALVEAGLDLAISKSATLGLSYTGQLTNDAQDHAFKGNLAVKF